MITYIIMYGRVTNFLFHHGPLPLSSSLNMFLKLINCFFTFVLHPGYLYQFVIFLNLLYFSIVDDFTKHTAYSMYNHTPATYYGMELYPSYIL